MVTKGRPRLMVIGGLGFIGSRLVELASESMDLLVLDSLTYAGRTANLSPELLRQWRRCDLNDEVLLAHMLREFQPDYVVNLAAETHVTRSLESQEAFVRTNVVGVNTLLNCCLDYWRGDAKCSPNFRLLQASTDEVYGSLTPHADPWTEDSPLHPNNPYAASKAAGEMLALACHRTFGLPVVVTRGSNVFGPRQHPEKAVPTFARQLLLGEPVTLHGDGMHIREWVYVDDHCRGLLGALTCRGSAGHCYNLAGGRGLASLNLAMALASVMGVGQTALMFVKDREGNDRIYDSDASKAELHFGWAADNNSFGRRLAETADWYRQAYEGRYQDVYGR